MVAIVVVLSIVGFAFVKVSDAAARDDDTQHQPQEHVDVVERAEGTFPKTHRPFLRGGSGNEVDAEPTSATSTHTAKPTPIKLPWGGPVPPVSIPNSTTGVHLIISSFRDGERCARSLGFALKKAKFPERIHFRVMQALEATSQDISCAEHFVANELKDYCSGSADADCEHDVLRRTRIWVIPLEEGMGPAHQRGLLNEQLDYGTPDTFCMSTDSHMDFRHNWDDLMIKDWLVTRNEFAVLTAYPAGMEEGQEWNTRSDHVDLCGYSLENGIPRGRIAGNIRSTPNQKPYLTMNWAAGFSFHRCHADRNVPVDKNLRWIFTGEEINRAVRLWTNGYDLYLPSGINVFHDYSAAKQDFWNHADAAERSKSERVSKGRLQSLLGMDESGELPELGAFGLGKQRSLKEFVEWSHIDLGTENWRNVLRAKHIQVEGNSYSHDSSHMFCQKLGRVPVQDVHKLISSVYRGGPPAPSVLRAPIPLLHGEGPDDTVSKADVPVATPKFDIPEGGHGGCCQESEDAPIAACWEYIDGLCKKLRGRVIPCKRGFWAENTDYDIHSGLCSSDVFYSNTTEDEAEIRSISAGPGGCCQESETDTKAACWEYYHGTCEKLRGRDIPCERGYWVESATYDKATRSCKVEILEVG